MVTPFVQMPKLIFDFGAIQALPLELRALGSVRPLLITDAGLVSCGTFDRVRTSLQKRNFHVFDRTPENPTSQGVEQAFAAYTASKCDAIVAIGGGSVIDTAKMVAVLAGEGGRLSDFLGHPERVTANIAPLIAIPTTASSGSEASPGCGIHPEPNKRAIGTRSHNLVPRVAICDPEMTVSLPPRLTAGTGVDALSHCIEGFLSKAVNPVIDAIALEGVRHVCSYLQRAVSDGEDREARWHMMLGGFAGGTAIAKGLGPAHAMANALGDRGFHHGLLCAISLPIALDVVGAHVREKMEKLAHAFDLKRGESVSHAVRDLNFRVGIPDSLNEAGFGDVDIDELAADATASPFNKASSYVPTSDEYRTMFAIAIEGRQHRSTAKCSANRIRRAKR
jgi:4-hydroxybutyrate dehydrogenase